MSRRPHRGTGHSSRESGPLIVTPILLLGALVLFLNSLGDGSPTAMVLGALLVTTGLVGFLLTTGLTRRR